MDSWVVDVNCEYLGVPRMQLMECAGAELARACLDYKNVAVFAGTGGNGGDGFVAARHLSGYGKKVKVVYLRGIRTRECEKNFDVLKEMDIPLLPVRDSGEIEKIKDEVAGCDCIIDALIGVGIRGGVREPVKSLINLINSLNIKKISADVPSGTEELSVNADQVIAFDQGKTEGATVVNIGIPPEAKLYVGPGDVLDALPKREAGKHKGDYGRLLVVGGSRQYTGTPTLVATAAFSVGVDLVTVACPSYVSERMPFNPNLIVRPLEGENIIEEKDVDAILGMRCDAMVLGNGLGLEEHTIETVRKLVDKVEVPVVADADALKALKIKHLKKGLVLTPHAAEFESLFGEYDEEKRVELTKRYAKKRDTIIALKGAVDVISDGETTRLNRTGNPAMTVGGTGDTLAGAIGGLLAQNLDPMKSAAAGTFLNGFAGDLAFEEKDVGLTATDVIGKMPEAIKFCRGFL